MIHKPSQSDRRCALCQSPAPLQLSHLIARGFYKYARTYEGEECETLVSVHGGMAQFDSRQISGYLLCRQCEGLFNDGGEKPVLKACDRSNPLKSIEDRVLALPRLDVLNGIEFYDASRLGPIRGQLVYFAVSVVWRWSVGYELWPDHSSVRHPLGPYEGHLRRFLMGEEPLPSSVHVDVQVIHTYSNAGMLGTPFGQTKGSPRAYTFWVPGIRFTVYIGKVLPPVIREHVLSGSRPVVELCALEYSRHFSKLKKSFDEARPVGKFAQSDLA